MFQAITSPSYGLKTGEEETLKMFFMNLQQSFPFPKGSIRSGLHCAPGNH